MDKKVETETSKFLSLVLRHKPKSIGIKLDENGWTDVDELIHKLKISFDDLKYIVDNNDKKRFAFNNDFTKIRASQGHSVEVDLQYKPVEPPEFLYHGTATKNLDLILREGLLKRSRQYVHLSSDKETAEKVGTRHGKPVILKIKTREMHNIGIPFYISDNKVWLVDSVPPEFIFFEEEPASFSETNLN